MKVYRLITSVETEIYDIVINDQTQLQRRLMAEDKIVCPVVVNSLLNFEIGDYTKWNGAKYYINRDPVLDEISDVEFRYNITFEGEIYNLIDLLFMLDRGTAFQLTEFTIYGNLQFFVDKITAQVGWPAAIITSTAKARNVTFTGINCREALNKLCSEFSCEFSVNGNQLTFKDKIENITALTFNRGRNAGLYTLTKEPVDDGNTITKAYLFGSTRNITFLYGHPRLTVSPIVASSENLAKYPKIVEKNVVFESIWPQFIGTVATVGADFLSITCPQIDFNLTDAQLNGIFSKIVFLDGDLAGNQFDIPSNSYDPVTKTVKFKQIVKTDGQSLPTDTGTWAPHQYDKFTFVDLNMLPAYITDAENRLTAAGTEWLDYYSKLRVKYKLVLDPRYLRKNVINLNIGDVVTITGGIQLRIIGMQYPILYPERVTAEISNFRDEFYENKISTQISDTLQKISEVKAENSISTIVLRHIWYDAPTRKLMTDVGLHVGGTIEASEEVIAWVSNAVSGTVLAGLTGQDPIYKVSESVVGLKFDTATLAVVGGKLTVVGGGGTPTGTGGTVTSVELALPAEFNVSGNPLTLAGTLTGSWASQLQGKVFASPAIAAGIPTFRALVASDIPILNQNTTGNATTATNASQLGGVSSSQFWHAGNFTPSNYLPLAGGELSRVGNGTPILTIASAGSLANQIVFRAQINGLTNGFTMYQDASSIVNYNFLGKITTDGTITAAGSVTATGYKSTKPQSNVLLDAEYFGLNGYWGIRTNTLSDFNIDVYGNGSKKQALNIAQDTGNATFGGGVTCAELTTSSFRSSIGFYFTTPGFTAYQTINTGSIVATGTGSFTGSVTAGGGNSTEWNEAHTKSIPFTVTAGKVTIDRDLEVTGNITASKDVVSYVAGAVTSDVLSSLTATAPLRKSSASNIVLDLSSQFNTTGGILGINSDAFNLANYYDKTTSDGRYLQTINSTLISTALGYVPEFPLTFGTGLTRTGNTITNNITQYTDALAKSAIYANPLSNGFAYWNASTSRLNFKALVASDIPVLNYLPLAGGTLTGALNGTSATFSGSVTAPQLTVNAATGANFQNTILFNKLGGYGASALQQYYNSGSDYGFAIAVNTTQFTLNQLGNATFSGSVTATSIIAPLYTIRNASGVLQWTVSVGTGERLEFKNASGVIEMTLSQSGAIDTKSEITAYVNL